LRDLFSNQPLGFFVFSSRSSLPKKRWTASVILLEIDLDGVTVLKAEGETPGSVYRNRIPTGVVTFQRMKFIARNVKVSWLLGCIQSVEPLKQSSVKLRGYLGGCTQFE